MSASSGVMLLDLDNCIADDAWRMRLVNHSHPDPIQRWDAYHRASAHDEVRNRWVFERAAARIFILTGRPHRYRPLTDRWLRVRARLNYDLLFMRHDADTRPSAAVKRGMLWYLVACGMLRTEDVVAAWDDRADIIAMYRAEGIANARLCAIHDNHSAYPEAENAVHEREIKSLNHSPWDPAPRGSHI